MLKALFQSFIKSKRLKKVSKKLAEPLKIQDALKVTLNKNQMDNYLDELIDIAESDKYVKMVMNKYNAERKTLKELYSKLTLVGAGQYARGHYVAASSLVYPLTLKFLLEHFDGENLSINNWDANNSALYIADRLIEYFDKGRISKVE